MRKWKNLTKRGFALCMALVMCVGLLQISAFASPVSGDYGGFVYSPRGDFKATDGTPICVEKWDFDNPKHPYEYYKYLKYCYETGSTQYAEYLPYVDEPADSSCFERCQNFIDRGSFMPQVLAPRTVEAGKTAVFGYLVTTTDHLMGFGSQVPSVYLYDVVDVTEGEEYIDGGREALRFYASEEKGLQGIWPYVNPNNPHIRMDTPVKADAPNGAQIQIRFRLAYGFEAAWWGNPKGYSLSTNDPHRKDNYYWYVEDFVYTLTVGESKAADVVAYHDLYIPAGYSTTMSLSKAADRNHTKAYELSNESYEQDESGIASIVKSAWGYETSSIGNSLAVYDNVTIQAAEDANPGDEATLYVTYHGTYATYKFDYWEMDYVPVVQDEKDFMDVINVHIVAPQEVTLNTTDHKTETILPQAGTGTLSTSDLVFQGMEDGKILTAQNKNTTITANSLNAKRVSSNERVDITAKAEGAATIEHHYHYYDDNHAKSVYYDELDWYVDAINVTVSNVQDDPSTIDGLSIKKEVDKETVVGGETLTYTITVSNSSGVDKLVTVTDNLAYGLTPTNLSGRNDVTYDSTSGQVTWTTTVPAGGTQTLVIECLVADNSRGGLHNQATLESADGSTLDSNSVTTTVTPKPVSNPALTGITKDQLTVVPAGVTLPADVTLSEKDAEGKYVADADGKVTLLYQITVTGDEGAKYIVTDEGAVWVGGDQMTGTIGESGTAVIYVTKTFTEDDVNGGKVSNTAYVKPGDNTDLKPSDPNKTPDDEKGLPSDPVDSDVTPASYELEVKKTMEDSKASNIPEDEEWVSFTVTVTNKSNQPLYNLMLVDTMDQTLEMVSDSIDVQVTQNGENTNSEFKGTREFLEPKRDEDGRIIWTDEGGVTRLEDGETKWDHTWTLEGAFQPGAKMTVTYDAKIIYPAGASTVEFYNYADALAGTEPGDSPKYDGDTVEELSDGSLRMNLALYSFVGGSSGSVGSGSSGSGPVGGQRTKYTLIYNFDGGTWNNESSYINQTKGLPDVSYTFTVDGEIVPEKFGFEFKGWKSQDGKITYGAGAEVPVTRENPSKTIVASWEPKTPDTVTVTFNPNGGSWSGFGSPQTVTVESGKTIAASGEAVPDAPSKGTDLFLGWFTESTGGEKVDPATATFDEDTTLYAHWQENEVKVTVNWVNGSDIVQTEEIPEDEITGDDNGIVVPKEYYPADAPTENGYWSDPVWESDGSITITWVDETAYTVTYDWGDHAPSTGEAAPVDSAGYTKGSEVTALAPDVTQETVDGVEYTFAGWTLSTGGTVNANDTFTMPGEDVTLTAIWTKQSVGVGNPEDPDLPSHELLAGLIRVVVECDNRNHEGVTRQTVALRENSYDLVRNADDPTLCTVTIHPAFYQDVFGTDHHYVSIANQVIALRFASVNQEDLTQAEEDQEDLQIPEVTLPGIPGQEDPEETVMPEESGSDDEVLAESSGDIQENEDSQGNEDLQENEDLQGNEDLQEDEANQEIEIIEGLEVYNDNAPEGRWVLESGADSVTVTVTVRCDTAAPDVTYTLRYNANGGSGTLPAAQTVTAPSGSAHSAVVGSGSGLSLSGYSFQGWSTTPAGGVNYRPGASINLTGNVTLYAVWTRNATPSTPSGGGSSGGSSGGRPGTNPTNPGAGNTTTIGDVDVPLAGDLQLNKTDHFAYIKGYQDGTVRPNNPITRAQVATIFYRLLDETSRVIYFQETNDFTDVTDSYWANKAISTLSNAGIITGFNDGTFRPNAYITRAQFAAIAARFDNVVPGLNNPFTDVAEDYWARDLIAFAADRGWITGNGGKFRPLENITRVEVMDFINNVLERHVDKDGLLENAATWSDVPVSDPNYYVVEEATNSHDYTRRTEGQLMENWTKLNEDPVWDE